MAQTAVEQMPAEPWHDAMSTVMGLCLLGTMPALCLAAELTATAAYLACGCLVAATTLFWRTSRRFFLQLSLVGVFGLGAAAHAFVGFLLARPTTGAIWASSRVFDYYPKAFLVVSAGLLAVAIGYRCALNRRWDAVEARCARLSVDESKLRAWAQALTVSGALLIILVYYRLGYIPLLTSSPALSRYLTADVSANYQLDEWIVNRGMDLLTLSLPLLLAWSIEKPSLRIIVLTACGGVALLLPLRRANLISIVVAVVIMEFLRSGRLKKRYLAGIVLVLLLYGMSQLIFADIFNREFDASEAVTAVGSSLAEVRDLGWMMSLTNDTWYGVTFLQAALPIPSVVSDFSREHSLRHITTRAIGLDDDGQTGGLRLTLAGESYFNFGYLGVVSVGFLFGILCALVDIVINVLRRRQGTAGRYVSALLFTWFCFWLYLAGTQAGATIKIGLVLAAGILYLSRGRTVSALRTSTAT